MACDVMSIGKILIGNFENKISDNKGRSYLLDFGLFFFFFFEETFNWENNL